MKKLLMSIGLGVACCAFIGQVYAAFVLTAYTNWNAKDVSVSLTSAGNMPTSYNAIYDVDYVSGSNNMKIDVQHPYLVVFWQTVATKTMTLTSTGRTEYPVGASASVKTKFIYTKTNDTGSVKGFGGYIY